MACITTSPAAAQPETIAASSPLSIDYESKEAKDDSEFQVLWSRITDKGPYKNPSTYEKVDVLLLSWAKDSDDIDPECEVSRLKSVFEDRFKYHTHTEYLDHNSGQGLQLQVNHKIAAFVYENDGPQTLLIVYYAGHGRPGPEYGEMEIYGQTSENDQRNDEKKQQWNRVVWNQTEDLLRPARADVLEIFDCCYAGTLGLTKGEDRRSFEYLAATKPNRGTPVPGNDSFTSALIFALNELVDATPGGRFTTVELLRKIKDHPPFPKDQSPVLSDRRVKDTVTPVGRIMLHPLQDNSSKCLSPKKVDDLISVKQTITLHFDFGKELSSRDVRTLGEEINKFSEHNASLVINGVRWGGLKQPIVTRIVQTLKDRVQQSSMRRKQAYLGIGNSEDAQDTPGPPTPSSISQNSPRQLEHVTQGNLVKDSSLLSSTSPSTRSRDTTPHRQSGAKRQRVGRDRSPE